MGVLETRTTTRRVLLLCHGIAAAAPARGLSFQGERPAFPSAPAGPSPRLPLSVASRSRRLGGQAEALFLDLAELRGGQRRATRVVLRQYDELDQQVQRQAVTTRGLGVDPAVRRDHAGSRAGIEAREPHGG